MELVIERSRAMSLMFLSACMNVSAYRNKVVESFTPAPATARIEAAMLSRSAMAKSYSNQNTALLVKNNMFSQQSSAVLG